MKRIVSFAVFAVVTILGVWHYLLTRPPADSLVPPSKQLVAEYDRFLFISAQRDMFRFVTGLTDSNMSQLPVARIYIRCAQGAPLLLSEITENQGREIASVVGWRAVPIYDTMAFAAGRSMLQFHKNRLMYATFFADDCPFELGPSQDGPFVRLPISREEMIEVFGRPNRWYFGYRRG